MSYDKFYTFCLNCSLYLHVWIRNTKSSEYGSNTDPQHCLEALFFNFMKILLAPKLHNIISHLIAIPIRWQSLPFDWRRAFSHFWIGHKDESLATLGHGADGNHSHFGIGNKGSPWPPLATEPMTQSLLPRDRPQRPGPGHPWPRSR